MPFELDLAHRRGAGRSTIAVVGVIDLRAGQAVHARGGRREAYRPVEMVAGRRITPGDAVALAREYVERLGVDGLYVADLDAILREPPQGALVRALSGVLAGRAPLWLDAGVTTVEGAQRALALAARGESPAGIRPAMHPRSRRCSSIAYCPICSVVAPGDRGAAPGSVLRRDSHHGLLGERQAIVGLETLETFETLDAICAAVGGARIAFSLDLRNGVPVSRERVRADGLPAPEIARRAADAGVGTVLVLDVARVGMEGGPDLSVIARVRDAVPHVVLLAGGGVRGGDDLRRLSDAGCDGALVASALLSGALV